MKARTVAILILCLALPAIAQQQKARRRRLSPLRRQIDAFERRQNQSVR